MMENVIDLIKLFAKENDFSRSINIYLISFILYWSIIRLYKRYKIIQSTRNWTPFFWNSDLRNKCNYFVESRFQNNSPVWGVEPGFTIKYNAKAKLIPFFIKRVFNKKHVHEKFYLVLADSGMGKTTALINLFLRYNSLFNINHQYNIKLISFGYKGDIIEKIKEIPKEDINNTILLLDAFDEYDKILPPDKPDGLTDDERFRKVLNEVICFVQDFRIVVITCRTQYFPSQEDKDYELEILRPDDQGFQKLVKLYLSPFDDVEIRSYLNKKYGVLKFWNRQKKKKALEIVNNSPMLMVRPMLLNYIDFLVKDNQKYSNAYQIYEALVHKWIEREADKRNPDKDDRERFKKNLYSYSQQVALKIYEKQKEIRNYQLPKADAIAIDVELQNYQMTGQSLLTRDIDNNWKFAHKSVYEFLLAKECFENPKDNYDVNFIGLELAQQFYNELLLSNTLPRATYDLFSEEPKLIGRYKILNSKPENIINIEFKNLNKITYLDLFDNTITNLSGLRGLVNLQYINLVNNNIDLNQLLDYENFLITKIRNYDLAMLIRHQFVSINWRNKVFKSESFDIRPDDLMDSDRTYIPSKDWYLMIDILKNELLTYELQTGLNIRFEYLSDFILTLDKFIELTKNELFNAWNHYYIKTLDIWMEKAMRDRENLIEKSKIHQPITKIVYRPGQVLDPIHDSKIFVGRDDLKEELQHEIFVANSLPLFLIQGQRRVGKTSLLRFLPLMLGDRIKVIYIDLQAIESIYEWFEEINNAFVDQLRINVYNRIDNDNGSWTEEWKKLSKALVKIADQSQQKIIIAFDEYEKIHDHFELDKNQAVHLLSSIRSFTQNQKKIIFLFVGSALFSELENPDWALYFTHAVRIKVDYLAKKPTLSLIRLMDLDFQDDLPNKIFYYTQGHPTLTQIICKGLEDITYEKGRKSVNIADLEDIIRKKIIVKENGVINVFWNQFCRKIKYKEIVLAIVFQKVMEITNELSTLIEHGFVIKENELYKMRVPLFEQWIIASHSNKWF